MPGEEKFVHWNKMLKCKQNKENKNFIVCSNHSDGYTQTFTIVCEIHFYLPIHNNVVTISFK